MQKPHLHIRNKEAGMAAIEFALLLPLLVVLLCGVVEYGWFMKTRIALYHAVSEGARSAIRLSDPSVREAAARINTRQALSDMTNAGTGSDLNSYITVSEITATSTLPHRLSVTVKNWPYKALTGLIPVPATIPAAAVMALPN